MSSQRESDYPAAEPPAPNEIVCTLVVATMLDDFEVEIRCHRTNGVDRVFSTSMDWLGAERPSESTLTPTRPVASRWFNLMSTIVESAGDVWIHREKDQLWWTISLRDAPSFEPLKEPVGDRRDVIICHTRP
jgi:hypothetical protein